MIRDGLVAVAEWEVEHGGLTDAEMVAARRRIAAEMTGDAHTRSA